MTTIKLLEQITKKMGTTPMFSYFEGKYHWANPERAKFDPIQTADTLTEAIELYAKQLDAIKGYKPKSIYSKALDASKCECGLFDTIPDKAVKHRKLHKKKLLKEVGGLAYCSLPHRFSDYAKMD